MVARFVVQQDWFLNRLMPMAWLWVFPASGAISCGLIGKKNSQVLCVHVCLICCLTTPAMRLETLLSSLNDHLFLGHFRLSSDKRQVQLYYVLPLRGAGGATPEQIEDVVDILLGQCEQAAPAFAQLVSLTDQRCLRALIMVPVVSRRPKPYSPLFFVGIT